MKLTINVKHNDNKKLQPIIHNALWHAARNPAWTVEFLDRTERTAPTTEDTSYEEKI